MRKAVFFDRDGVINNEESHYYIYKEKDFIFNEGITDVMMNLSEKGYLLIIITNQSGISKGVYSHKDVDKVHAKMKSELSKEGISLAEIYYCPHHPDNENCLCRKPKSLLLEKGIARFNIDVEKSYFIGDKDRDIQAGKKAGLKTILVKANGNMTGIINLIKA